MRTITTLLFIVSIVWLYERSHELRQFQSYGILPYGASHHLGRGMALHRAQQDDLLHEIPFSQIHSGTLVPSCQFDLDALATMEWQVVLHSR